MADPWRSRIVGEADVSPVDLIPHPENWRRHPATQTKALSGALAEIGWVQRVVVNRRSGRIIDGHARVELASARGEASVPVVYVDLDDNEERIALASLDPLAALAETDSEALAKLLEQAAVSDESLRAMFDELRPTSADVKAVSIPQLHQVLAECDSEDKQRELYERLREEGYTCRLLTL